MGTAFGTVDDTCRVPHMNGIEWHREVKSTLTDIGVGEGFKCIDLERWDGKVRILHDT